MEQEEDNKKARTLRNKEAEPRRDKARQNALKRQVRERMARSCSTLSRTLNRVFAEMDDIRRRFRV